MTSEMFFDTDCLSSFLWINNTNLLHELYGGRIVLPEPVYQELSNPRVPQLKGRADALIASKDAFVQSIQVGSEEYKLYSSLIQEKDGKKSIGRGEAAGIALAKGLITEEDGNSIWSQMLAKRRHLPTNTFSEYLKCQ